MVVIYGAPQSVRELPYRNSYGMTMERVHLLDDLQTYKTELQAELRRVNAALNALTTVDQEVGAAADSVPTLNGIGTYDLLRAFVLEQPRFDANSAYKYLVRNGWKADDRGDALNAVRSALAHLTAWGEIERVRRGVYRIRPPQARKTLPHVHKQTRDQKISTCVSA
jgi:hypothetical protein